MNNNLIESNINNLNYKEYHPFRIKNMRLSINPNFKNLTVTNCTITVDIKIERKIE